MVRRKRNKIEALVNNAGEWIYDNDTLEKKSIDYFHDLYNDDDVSGGKDALWARVLRGKYHCGDDLIPQMKCSSNSSRLWKAVVRNWNHVNDGMEWRVPDCNRLCDIATAPIPSDIFSAKVSEYVTPSGEWNWNQFQFLIPDHARLKIAAILPPSDGNEQDKLDWKFSKDGGFSVKTAYQSIVGMNEGVEDNFFRRVWHLKVPQRVKSFIWLCRHNKLLTNFERVKRCMIDSSICTRCNSGSEDSLHVLRDCPRVKGIWMHLVKPCHWHFFFSADLHSWLKTNLQKNFGSTDLEWTATFAIACWSVWRWHNEHVFGMNDGIHTDPFFTIVQRVHNCNSNFGAMLSNAKRKLERVNKSIKWLPVEVEYGILLLLSGLCTAWIHGFRRVIIEVDSLVAYGMVQGSLSDSHPCASLVWRIHGLLEKDWDVCFQHIYREGNTVTDAMSRAAYQSGKDLSFVDNPPSGVAAALEADLRGFGSSRAVVV
ncbi:non-LTR retroelement reverse transcriptase-like [Senna tora]|uniref:Non-LTR retroelement reverse transcriptase-like n=1 Tax=Senna tora TaxID=362788 RepID=A0A834WYK0_9FABA|nr:non-LTR retroelement reverse transcriptase-like [Senna tora]